MPRQVDHAARRRELTHGVWAVIATRGLPAVTIRAVAEAAGVSPGRVQHYFPSREALVRHACLAMVDDAANHFEVQAPLLAAERVRELLVQPIPRSEEFRAGARIWQAFVAESVVDDAIGDIVREAKAGVEAELHRLLEQSGATPGCARALLALSDGLATRCLIGSLTAEEATEVIDAELGRVLASREATYPSRPAPADGMTSKRSGDRYLDAANADRT